MEHAERIYEVPVWLRLDATGSVDEALIERMRDALLRLGARVLSLTKPVKRRLAYPIAKHREGAFVVFEVSMKPSDAGRVVPAFKHDANIIRIGIFEKHTPGRQALQEAPARPRPAERAEVGAQRQERPQVKMEELEKKLEEILHGNSGV